MIPTTTSSVAYPSPAGAARPPIVRWGRDQRGYGAAAQPTPRALISSYPPGDGPHAKPVPSY